MLRYHGGHRRCKIPAKACRWRLAAQWHTHYVHALKQKPLVPPWVAWANMPGPRCVSSKEGGVTTDTGNGYYGKWQADLSFARTYNRRAYYGISHLPSDWPEAEQDLMAWRGHAARGWSPWPNTARACGLL